jgi:hypothetical protein
MSLFATHLFAGHTLGQVTLPEPASDELIHELATTGGRTVTTPSRTVEPSPTPDAAKGARGGMLPKAPGGGGGLPTWAPYAMIGGGVLFAGLLIWSATRRPTANRRRRRRRR